MKTENMLCFSSKNKIRAFFSQWKQLLIPCCFLLLPFALSGQTEQNEKQKRIDNKIHRIRQLTCKTEFGKADSCYTDFISVYDSKGNITEMISSVGKPYETRSTYSYNEQGKLTTVKQISKSDTSVSVYTYDQYGNKTGNTHYRNSVLYGRETFLYKNKLLVSTEFYDSKNELTTKTSYTYSGNDILLFCRWSNIKTGISGVTHFDSKEQPVNDTTWNGSQLSSTTVRIYERDTLVYERNTSANGMAAVMIYTYNTKKQLIRRESFSFDQNDSSRTVKACTYLYSYDTRDNLIEESSNTNSATTSARFVYDENGNRTENKNNRKENERTVAKYYYNEKKELVREVHSRSGTDSTIAEFSYDAAHHKTEETIYKSKLKQSSGYIYDKNGFLVSEKRYMYDRNDSALLYYEINYENNGKGKPVKAIHSDYSAGMLLTQNGVRNSTSPAYTFTMRYTYDERDSLLSILGDKSEPAHRPLDNDVRYIYNKNGYLAAVETYYPGSEQLKFERRYERDEKGRITSVKIYIGKEIKPFTTIRLFYDDKGVLTDQCSYSTWGELTEHLHYLYDEAGHRIAEIDMGKSGSYTKYTYETY